MIVKIKKHLKKLNQVLNRQLVLEIPLNHIIARLDPLLVMLYLIKIQLIVIDSQHIIYILENIINVEDLQTKDTHILIKLVLI